MPTVVDFCNFLEQLAPPRLAEDWDNTGLLVGDSQRRVQKVMTCLTITPASAEEAVAENADLIVAHHPLPFRSLKRLTTSDTPSRLLLQLIEAKIAVYSPHTSFDSAARGINQLLAEGMGLQNIRPLAPIPDDADQLGAGRLGQWPAPISLDAAAALLKKFVRVAGLHAVGQTSDSIQRVAVACGSAGTFLPAAADQQCDLLVTGETTFHTCLEAEALGVALLLPGHFASERFGVETLAAALDAEFPPAAVWASRREQDPLRWV